MTALIVWSVILAVLAILVFSRVYIGFSYDETGFFLKISYLFFSTTIFDSGEVKPSKPKKAKEKKKKKKEPTPGEEKKQKLKPNIKKIIPLAKAALKRITAFVRKIRIDFLGLNLSLATDDAAKTAKLFGDTAAAAGIILPLLESVFRVKKRDIRVCPDFASSKTAAQIYIAVSIRVSSMFSLLFGMIKLALPAVIKGELFEKIPEGGDNAPEQEQKAA